MVKGIKREESYKLGQTAHKQGVFCNGGTGLKLFAKSGDKMIRDEQKYLARGEIVRLDDSEGLDILQ